MITGLDVLRRDGFAPLRGKAVALLCNQASVAADLTHAVDVFAAAHRDGLLSVRSVFGPQHGIWGHTQDNMIEWEGFEDPHTGFTVHSLYGRNRKPTPAMLEGVDVFVVDLPDVGARPYTYLWTMDLCLESCAAAGIPIVVLDRPNPLTGLRVEGPVLDSRFASFIGRRPLPMRHGMTMGEAATLFSQGCARVVRVEGWDTASWFDEAETPWAAPSPNMPSPDTATVYPGMCLLEGTNLSEGRGTTQPFETFGAPFLDGWALCDRLNGLNLPGAHFRRVAFEPTFEKHAGEVCEGAFVHVTDRAAFEPVITGIAVLREVRRMAPHAFAWKEPPFEYEDVLPPIDILAGNDWVRRAVEEEWSVDAIRERLIAEADAFAPIREEALYYPRQTDRLQ